MTTTKRTGLNLVEDYELTLIECADLDYDIKDILDNTLFGQEVNSSYGYTQELKWLTTLANQVDVIVAHQPELGDELPEGYDLMEDKYLALLQVVSTFITARINKMKSNRDSVLLEQDCLTVASMKLNQEHFH